MSRAEPAHLALARLILAHEASAASADRTATTTTASGRVYDKLHAQMGPLVGQAGVELLLLRSAKLAQGKFARITEVPAVERSATLRGYLHAQDLPIDAESAAVLYATFFGLITTFIGERLTTQILRSAWPNIDATTFRETKQ